MRFFKKKRTKKYEIAPDEIFLDATNPSGLDQARFEGRFEKPITRRTFTGMFIALAIICVVLLAQAGKLQVIQGAAYSAESANNTFREVTLFASRGIIVGIHNNVLAYNVQTTNGSVRRRYTIPGMGQIIGYVSYPKKDKNGYYYDTKENGLAGLEAEYNATLSGTNGKILTERDALGRVRSQGAIVPPKNGKTLRLSIDANLERALTKALADVTNQYHFSGGAGVIMDVHTGAVRAIASYPSYDPNVMSNGVPASTIAGYNTNPRRPFLDRAIQGVYAPGSIVKPFIAAGALTDGIITTHTIIDDKGVLKIPDPYRPGHSFLYTGWKALGPVDVRKAIAWSSDIFFYTVGGGFGNQKGLGIKRLDYWYHQFGLGKPTGIDLPGEANGLIPSPVWKKAIFHKPWYLGDTYFTAIGQYAMLTTPIQMARATVAIANNGTLFIPTLLAEQKPSGTKVPVTAATFQVVREGMRRGVTKALAWEINLPYLAVAAKTGTAQVGFKNLYDNSWVEGFFPYDHPEYAFAVVLGHGPYGMGEKAVTVMQRIFETLHSENSPYVGGTNVSTSTALYFGTSIQQ